MCDFNICFSFNSISVYKRLYVSVLELFLTLAIKILRSFPKKHLCENRARCFKQASLQEKCPNTELFLVRIFLYSDWIRRDTPCLSVFSPNTGKYGTEMAPYLDTSCNVGKGKQGSNFLILLSSSYNFIKLQTQVKVYKTSLRDFLTLNGYWSFTVGFHVLVWSWSL